MSVPEELSDDGLASHAVAGSPSLASLDRYLGAPDDAPKLVANPIGARGKMGVGLVPFGVRFASPEQRGIFMAALLMLASPVVYVKLVPVQGSTTALVVAGAMALAGAAIGFTRYRKAEGGEMLPEPTGMLNGAEEALRDGDLHEAIEALKTVLVVVPPRAVMARTHLMLALCADAEGNWGEARLLAEMASEEVAAPPDVVHAARAELAFLQALAHDARRAREELTQATSGDPLTVRLLLKAKLALALLEKRTDDAGSAAKDLKGHTDSLFARYEEAFANVATTEGREVSYRGPQPGDGERRADGPEEWSSRVASRLLS